MAFTTLIADAFQGSGAVTGLATNGVAGAAWTQSFQTNDNNSNSASSALTRGSSGAVLTASAAMGSSRQYALFGSWTGPIQTGGLIWEVGVYGPIEKLQFDPTNLSGESFPYGTLFVDIRANGDINVDTWGGIFGFAVPATNIGAVSSSTLTILQVFYGTGNDFITLKVNGSLVYTLPTAQGLPTLSTSASVARFIGLEYVDKSFLSSAGSVGGPFTNNTTVLKYVHVATGTLSGTYLGSPPQRIDGAVAVVATASATLTTPPKPPDASVSYPFQNFVAWNEVASHVVSLQSARPLKLSRTAVGVQAAVAMSSDGSKLAVYILGNGDRWLSGGLMSYTPSGWVHVGALPDRLYSSGLPLSLALDGTGRRMICTNSTGWTLFTRDAPGMYFDEQGVVSAPAVALGLDARGMTAAVLTSTAVLIYTSATTTAPFALRTTVPLPATETWLAMTLSGDGAQLIVSGAAHSLVFTRTGENWDQAVTADMPLLYAAINTDGTLATGVEGSLLRTRGLQNARNLTTPVTPEVSTVGGVALTSAITRLTEAAGAFRLVTALSRSLPATYGLGDGMAVMQDLPVVRTYESAGDPRFRMAAQPASNSAARSGFWQEPSDETS